MKYFLLGCIRLYWLLVPKEKRRTCLHRISCSHFVYEVTKKEGFLEGFQTFRYRYKTCRPNHEVVPPNDKGEIMLVLPDGSILKENEISLNIIKQYKGNK